VHRTEHRHRDVTIRNFGRKGRGVAAAADISKGSLLLDEVGIFTKTGQDKKLVAAVLTNPDLSRELETGTVFRSSERVSFLTDFTSEQWVKVY